MAQVISSVTEYGSIIAVIVSDPRLLDVTLRRTPRPTGSKASTA